MRSREWCKSFPTVTITLKDMGSQHGRIRGFTQEPTVVEVSLDLQEDEISYKAKDKHHVRRSDRPAYKNTDGFHKYPPNHSSSYTAQ